ncbi:MAG TPA: CBS domain-containing protein [Pyrinomonadaceae bacterium]|nr:CBS domain-containing protein [Pyrinomonadaceae bacterium]
MKVNQIMTQPVITITEDTTLREVARIMLQHRIGGLPVVDKDGHLTGIITESDFTAKEKCVPFSLFRAPQLFGTWLGDDAEELYAKACNIRAREVMSTNVVTVNENDPIKRVLELVLKHDVNRIPVVSEGKPVGIVARRDLLRMMKDQQALAVTSSML